MHSWINKNAEGSAYNNNEEEYMQLVSIFILLQTEKNIQPYEWTHWPRVKRPGPLLSSYPHDSMEHASVADLSVLAVAHLALNLETRLGQVDRESACHRKHEKKPLTTWILLHLIPRFEQAI